MAEAVRPQKKKKAKKKRQDVHESYIKQDEGKSTRFVDEDAIADTKDTKTLDVGTKDGLEISEHGDQSLANKQGGEDFGSAKGKIDSIEQIVKAEEQINLEHTEENVPRRDNQSTLKDVQEQSDSNIKQDPQTVEGDAAIIHESPQEPSESSHGHDSLHREESPKVGLSGLQCEDDTEMTESHQESLEPMLDGDLEESSVSKQAQSIQQTDEICDVGDLSNINTQDGVQELELNLSESTLHTTDMNPVLQSKTSTSTHSSTVKSEQETFQPIMMEQFLPPLSAKAAAEQEAQILPVFQLKNEVLSPFTEEQLKKFYFNPELEQVTVFIDQFLMNTSKEMHEFYELVNTYYKCKTGLVQVISEIKAKKDSIKTNQEKIWTPKQCQLKTEGYCQDKVKVQKVVNYEQMQYSEADANTVSRELKEIRDLLHEDYQLKCYNSQLARIRIESYIHEMMKASILLRSIQSGQPVTAVLPRNINSDDVQSLCLLQDCISVLFSFKRLSDLEEMFQKDLELWLEKLVSTLQRAGALPDHFFLLNHLVRCPPSTIAPIAHFLQFPEFRSSSSMENWNSPLVHHFIVMLATLALPVKERVKFLSKYKQTMKPTTNRAISWTLVDEDREEDENPEDSWSLLLETDLVSLFEQFPFESLLKFLLRMDESNGDVNYSPMNSTSNDIMRLLAFSSCLVKLLGQMFETYNLLRYRQFVKRISRTIRWIVQVLADHWCAYRSWRIEICGDSDKDIPKFMTVATQYSLERLQLEFDQFISKAIEQILQSHSVGALQFLASMPYEAVSTNAAWSLLNRLTHNRSEGGEKHQEPGITSVIPSVNAPGEAVFLLTSLANMALSRTKDDKDFIEVAAKNILEIAYVHKTTRDTCPRNARDLLATVSSKHPFLMSFLLWNIADLMETIDEDCVYILKALPFNLWYPEARDLEKIRSWLLENQLASLQHKMAKAVISQMNFDVNQETQQLFLPRHFHFAMAIMLVEVYGSCVPDGPGGLKNLEYDNGGFISQVGKFAVQSINKILNSQIQDEFLRWCWEILLSLKLHASDVPVHENVLENQSMLLTLEDSHSKEDDGSWFNRILSVFQKMDIKNLEMEHCPEMLNVQRAVDTRGHLACYVALAMTKLGHSPDYFISHGEKLLYTLLDTGWIDSVLRIINNIVPLFVKCMHLLNSSKNEFLRIIDALVHMDANKAGYTEKIWQYPEPGLYSQKLASVITHHIMSMSKQSDEQGNQIINLWFMMLCSLNNWYRDLSVQYLLDHICKVTYFVHRKMDFVVKILSDQFQDLVQLKVPRGIISSVMSWVTSSEPISLLEIKKNPDYSYYALAVLQMEMSLQEKSGLWKEVSAELVTNANMTAEIAFKKASSCVKAVYLPPFQSLSIFRWAEQGLSTNADHPLLPLIWQFFFSLFLQKQKQKAGIPLRTGVGYRFFDNVTRTSLSKKIRSHLYSTASYHKDKSVPKEDDEPVTTDIKSQIHDQTMHASLASLYQAMALWMEEPRLHDPSLFLEALPEIYKPALLENIFVGNEAPWLQFIDIKCIANEIESLESLWTMSLNKSTILKSRLVDDLLVKPTLSQQIVKRLNRESKPKNPPTVTESQNPVPDISLQLLLTRPRLIQDMNQDLERFVLFAKKSCIQWDENIALDEEYFETIVDLYEHVLRHFVYRAPCDGKNGKKGVCTGPANIVVRYEERCIRERNERNIRDNRAVWESNLSKGTQPLPNDLCTGAVYVENVINTLMRSLQYTSEEQKTELESAGVELFYLLAELINNDVRRCHPAIQFFSSCTEILGKEFIADNEAEQPRLLKTILSQDASVSFLAPHFNPSINSRNFLQLYAYITDSDAETTLTTTFVLLTKFDVRGWLGTQPAISERVFIVRAVMTSLRKFGIEPRKEVEIVFGLYRSHMLFLLSHRFPDQYNEILKLTAEASREQSFAPICWGDILTCIGCSIDGHQMAAYVEYNQLHLTTVNDTINWLAGFFAEVSRTLYFSTSKLYTIWKPYIHYITKFYTYLFSKLTEPYLTHESFTSNQTKERFISNTWSMIFAAYRPWIVPRKADKTWPSQHVEDAIGFVQSFTESARILAECAMYENTFSFGMNMIWTFYCAEVAAAIKEETSLEIYHSLLATLSWRFFCPSVQDLERMLELHIENQAAFYFLGTIFCSLDWSMVFNRYLGRGDANLVNSLHFTLLRIFAMLCVNRSFISKTGSHLEEFTNTAINCVWDNQNPQDISIVCGWFSENCDPFAVIEEEIYDKTVMKIFKSVCKFSPTQDTTCDFSQRRHIYVEMIVKIITRVAGAKFSHQRLHSSVTKLLCDIEKLFDARNISRNTLTMLLNSVFTLLNSISEGLILTSVENQIHAYLAETSCETVLLCSLSAGCRALASLDQLVRLCENAIDSFLCKQSDAEFKEAWPKILEVLAIPDLNQDEFVRKGLAKQCLVTLYAFNLHRLSLCTRPVETLSIIIETFRWCIETPPSPISSEKTILIWWQIVNGIKRIIETGEERNYSRPLLKYLFLFSHYCQQISEDKSYSGILGAIGFGKKSMLPVEFRFTARCLHVFLAAQLPGNGSALRNFPDAPGDIKGSVIKDTLVTPTNEAKNALQSLSNLHKNKTYASMKDEVRWMTQFISDPKTCLKDGPQLLSFVCKQLYYKTNFIVATVCAENFAQM